MIDDVSELVLFAWSVLPSWANESAQNLDEHFGQLIGAAQHCKAGTAEDSWRVARGFTIHCQTERVYALPSRFRHSLTRILDAVRPFIGVDVVRLSVGQDQQEPACGEVASEAGRGVADCGTDSCVTIRFERRDSLTHDLGRVFLESFH